MKKIQSSRYINKKTTVSKNSQGIPIVTGLDNTPVTQTITNIDGSTGTIDSNKVPITKIQLLDGTYINIKNKDLETIKQYRAVKDLISAQDTLLESVNIKILPTDFVPNDDNTYYNAYIEDDNNKFSIRAAHGVTSLYAMKEIPQNYSIVSLNFDIQNKAINGSTIEVFEGFINTKTSISKGSIQGSIVGNQNLTLDLSANPITYKSDNIIVIKFTPTNISDLFYGGTITAELT